MWLFVNGFLNQGSADLGIICMRATERPPSKVSKKSDFQEGAKWGKDAGGQGREEELIQGGLGVSTEGGGGGQLQAGETPGVRAGLRKCSDVTGKDIVPSGSKRA